MKNRGLMILLIVLFFNVCFLSRGAADAPNPIQIKCGGIFKPKVANVPGDSDNSVLRRLKFGKQLQQVSTNPAIYNQTLAYTEFCKPDDVSLLAECRVRSQQDAISDAIENCQKAAQSRGEDDNIYRCKREECSPPLKESSCVKHSAKNKCEVLVPQLQCQCSLKKYFEQPYASTSTVACGCTCDCTASGQAEMQCTNCDGTCVQIGGASFCGEVSE